MMSHLLVKAIILVCLNFVVEIKCGCPVSDNPSQMFQCLTINPQAFIDLISKGDYKSFCHMANGYMTCMTTYVRDCLGGKAATGILEELQDLNLKCCISGRAQECVVKSNLGSILNKNLQKKKLKFFFLFQSRSGFIAKMLFIGRFCNTSEWRNQKCNGSRAWRSSESYRQKWTPY